MCAGPALEEILHWLPACRILDVVMIGPDMPIHPEDEGMYLLYSIP